MELFKSLLLLESQQTSQKEIEYSIAIINKIYNEWKKKTRRKNAVDIIVTSANKVSTLDPNVVPLIHEASRLKLATIIMRCLDLPSWKPIENKRRIYKKLYPILQKLQNYNPQTGTGGTLKEVVLTRFSASVCHHDGNEVFVAYEPKIPALYLRYLFGKEKPKKTYKMEFLNLPEDFESLIEILNINQKKARQKQGLPVEDEG
jgi:hypothetical protein